MIFKSKRVKHQKKKKNTLQSWYLKTLAHIHSFNILKLKFNDPSPTTGILRPWSDFWFVSQFNPEI